MVAEEKTRVLGDCLAEKPRIWLEVLLFTAQYEMLRTSTLNVGIQLWRYRCQTEKTWALGDLGKTFHMAGIRHCQVIIIYGFKMDRCV